MIFPSFDKKKTKLLKFKCFIFTSILLYFVSNNLIYSNSLEKNETKYLIPMGNVIQIDAQLDNLFVRNIENSSPFKIGDVILKINGDNIDTYQTFDSKVSSLPSDKSIQVVVNRNSSVYNLNVSKNDLENIKLNNILCGFATLTYVDPNDSKFAAVAHPLSIGSNKNLPIKNGNVSSTCNLNISKSRCGNVGSLYGKRLSTIGKFNNCFSYGIKGQMSNFTDFSKMKKYEVANSTKDIQVGKAQIMLQNKIGKIENYDIEILNVENQKSPKPKSLKFKVLDKDLLISSGGVVQGMSGAPIVQGNKIIGAVSHALESDPKVGYGVFIKWMME